MGLLYPLPINKEEKDFYHFDQNKDEVTLKSYGLPYIFWIYGFISGIVIFFMVRGVMPTLIKLIESEDQINRGIGYSFIGFLIFFALSLLCFYFYQKVITYQRKSSTLTISHRVLGVTFYKKTISKENIVFEVSHFLDSANMARIHGGEDMRGFKNKGYFVLKTQNGDKEILIDRSSNQADLIKIQNLLEN